MKFYGLICLVMAGTMLAHAIEFKDHWHVHSETQQTLELRGHPVMAASGINVGTKALADLGVWNSLDEY